MTDSATIEDQGLRISVWGALFMAALGLGFASITSSQAILLDGCFSLIGFFVGLLTLKVSAMVRRPDDEEFQFGYAAFEPLLNLGKGLMLIGICTFALVSAVQSLFEGGRPIQSGPAVIYAFVAATGCFGVSWAQKGRAGRVNSPLLSVDAKHWFMDGAISSAVGVAFIAGALIQRTGYAAWVDFLDPALVVVLVVVTIAVPLGIIRASLWELLLGAPSRDVQEQTLAALHAVLGDEWPTLRLRLLKTGRSHFLLLHVLIPEGEEPSVQDLDTLRTRLHAAIPSAMDPFSLDVVFSRDRKWLQ